MKTSSGVDYRTDAWLLLVYTTIDFDPSKHDPGIANIYLCLKCMYIQNDEDIYEEYEP